MAQCIQCQLRRQECIFSATPKRRGRKGRGGDESPAKRVKLANEMPAPTNGTTLKPVIPTTRAAPRLLTSQQLMTSRNVEKGDATAYRPEDLVDLILAQQAKLEQKRQDLAEADISGLIDLSDFTQDSECEHTPFADVSFELDYADESALAEALFTGFSQRNGMYYPNGTVTVDVQLVKSYVHKFNSADLTRQLLNSSITEMTEAYCYGVFLSAACGVLLRWRLGIEYAGRTYLLLRTLIRHQVSRHEACQSKLVACTGFLIVFLQSCGAAVQCRNIILVRHHLYNSCSNKAPSSILAMLYSSLTGTSQSAETRLFWTNCSEVLPDHLRSPLTEVLRFITTLGEIYGREDPLLDWIQLTNPGTDTELAVRTKVYEAMDVAEAAIDTAPQYLYTRQDAAKACLHQMLYGCRALVSLLLGKHDEALSYTLRVVQNMRNVDPNILGIWQVYSNAFAIQVAVALMQRELYRTGMESLRRMAHLYPVGSRIIERLQEQYSHAETDMARYQMIGSALLPSSQNPFVFSTPAAPQAINPSAASALASWASIPTTTSGRFAAYPGLSTTQTPTTSLQNSAAGFVMNPFLAEEFQQQQQKNPFSAFSSLQGTASSHLGSNH